MQDVCIPVIIRKLPEKISKNARVMFFYYEKNTHHSEDVISTFSNLGQPTYIFFNNGTSHISMNIFKPFSIQREQRNRMQDF